MPDVISTLNNLEENWKKCAVKAKHFSNPGTCTMFMLVLVVKHSVAHKSAPVF